MSRPALSLGCLLADVHLAVVKLDRATRLALDGIARRVVIPPAIAVPRATRVVGRHCIVRAATIRGDRCGSVTTIISCPLPENSRVKLTTDSILGTIALMVIVPMGM